MNWEDQSLEEDVSSLIEAAARFLSESVARRLSAADLWDGVVEQGWLDTVCAAEAPSMQLLTLLSTQLGRVAAALPIAETVAPILISRQLGETASCAVLQELAAAGLPFALCLVGDGSLLRLEPWTVDQGFASGALCNVEHLGIARYLLVADANSHSIAWCALPCDGIRASVAKGYASPTWHDISIDRAPMSVIRMNGIADGLRYVLRLAAVARAWGAAERSVQDLAEYVKVREQFGQAIGRFQSMQHRLANLQITLNANRVLISNAARAFDRGDPEWRYYIDAAACHAGNSLRQLALECQHGFGAVGYMEEHGMPIRFRQIHADLIRHANPDAAAAAVAHRLLDTEDGVELVKRRTPLPPSAEALRAEVSVWLDQHWSEARRKQNFDRGKDLMHFDLDFLAAIGASGMIGLTIPQADGGMGRGALDQFAFDEEINFREAPGYSYATAQLLAPSLAKYGTAEQRARYLPQMLAGKAVFCLGYSEPNAGSDLASLKTRAERDGNGWIVNGSKIWTTLGTVSDYVWLAARTDPVQARHGGISVFIVPMSAPGITIKPLTAMNGEHPCAVFYDAVRLPAGSLVGEVNQGWSVITHALAQERMLMGSFASRLALLLSRLIDELKIGSLRRPGFADRVGLRSRLGQLAAEVHACRLLALEASIIAGKGGRPIAEAAISKTFSGELEERMAEAALNWFGPDATLGRCASGAILEGRIEQSLIMGIMYVIGGGSNDIQRNIIAQAALGLPR